VISSAVLVVSADDCAVDSADKVDCGYSTIQQDECESKGCCWQAVDGDPYCFYKANMPHPAPAPTTAPVSCFAAADEVTEPFSSDEVATMRSYFLANVNIEGFGTVVAGFNDASAVGGSYYYHWERDGAKTMRALQETNAASNVSDYMLSYANWVVQAQNFEDPNGIDVRIEPKYYLPDGGVFSDGWCRPQNDGPGLRAISLMIYANSLGTDSDIVKNLLWTGDSNVNNGGAIKHDLDWVVDGYNTNTCDLWEEVQSSDFFWNKVTMKKALYEGVIFAKAMGDESTASTYQATLDTINATLFSDHWTDDGDYVYESTNRMKDGAVIVGFNDGYIEADGMYAPTSAEVAATIKNYNMEFCHEWNINTIDTANGLPGVLYGRYPGDTYAGGNPWVLSTSALANLFYRGAIQIATEGMPDSDAQELWAEVFGISSFPSSTSDAADLFFRGGDGILLRLRSHVESDGFHLAEQIDRETGEQESAEDLTWSYAETLSAMASRDAYLAL
jgi:glucoamylase